MKADEASAITIVAGPNNSFAKRLAQTIRDSTSAIQVGLCSIQDLQPSATDCVYLPSTADPGDMAPDLSEAQNVFEQLKQHPHRMILISSALVYGAWPGRLGMVPEEFNLRSKTRDRISEGCRQLESLANQHSDQSALTILRPVPVLPSPTAIAPNLP